MQASVPKLSNPNDVVDQKELTMCLTFKVAVPHQFTSRLEELFKNAKVCISRMLQDRTKSSSKFYKEIPCVLAKSLISKYQRNKRLREVKRVVLPVCGDKGRQVKIVSGGIRIPAFFKKVPVPVTFPKPIAGFIRQVEFFKREGIWYMSYSYNTPKEIEYQPEGFIGVDRNSVGNVVVVANVSTGKVRKFGPSTAHTTKNFRNRRTNLQKKGAKNALTKIRRKQFRRTKDINHKVSRAVVDYAKSQCSAIVLEDLGSIAKKGKAKHYVQKSQWSFYQLESFIKYKAALLGIPVYYVDPAYTSQECSRCGSLNKPNGKHYKCSMCGHFDHRDANAAFNISRRGDQTITDRDVVVRCIGNPLNQRIDKAIQLESSGGAR